MRSATSMTDFDRLLLNFSRYVWILIGLSAGISVLAFFASTSQPRLYEATARLLSANPVEVGSGINTPQLRPLAAAAYREAAYGTFVVEQMRRRFPGAMPKELQEINEKLRIRSIETVGATSTVFVMSVRDSNPEQAAAMANAWAQALQDWESALVRENYKRAATSLESRLRWVNRQISQGGAQDMAGLRELRANLERDLGIMRSLEISATGQLSILSRAEVPTEAIWPRPLLTAGIAAVSTLMLGFILLTVRDRLLGP
ncbi:MAG: hypothetical protein N2318_09435 [Meiothermus sp.]|nr:hypothetical protein [Meiothermus sp.]